jgi:hypothetical protein
MGGDNVILTAEDDELSQSFRGSCCCVVGRIVSLCKTPMSRINEHVQLMVTYIILYRVTLLLPLAIYRGTLSANAEGSIATIG